jgi:hypothetical protein
MGARTRVALILTALVTIGASPAQTVAATSGGWSNLGHGATATQPAIAGKVYALHRAGTRLYVGGQFINAGGLAAADQVAVWNGSAWSALGSGITDGAVYAIAVDGSDVYVAGSFTNAGGNADADGLARWDGSSWHSVVSAGHPLGIVLALLIVGRTLFVSGGFDNANGIGEADSVAAYNLDTHVWSAITATSGDIGGTVGALAPDGSGGIYIGGYFLNADGIGAADFIAHWTGGTSWAAVGSGLNGRVWSIAVDGAHVYAGGEFINAGGDPNADHVARFNGSAWSGLGSSSLLGDGSAPIVYAIHVDGSTVFVAGGFLDAGGNARMDGIAAFSGGTWKNVGTNGDGTNGPASGQERALEVVGNKLFLGGLDSSIGGGSLNEGVASFRVRQPDEQVATTGSFIGNNVYNTTGASQTISRTVHRGQVGAFSIKVGNDGFATDGIKVHGPGSATGYTVHYLFGTTDITAQVVAGTYTLAGLPAGSTRTITLKVTVANGVSIGATHAWLITATSSGPGAAKDAVKATVKAS